MQPQIEILDLASNQRLVVLAQPRLGPAVAWIGDRLVYVLNETPPNQNDSNIWSVKIDLRTGKPLDASHADYFQPGRDSNISAARRTENGWPM